MSTSIEQVARLLAEIPYLQANQGITIGEVARVFGTTASQVRKDIIDVAIYCGLPGGYPSDLIDIDFDVLDEEGVLFLKNPTGLNRPLHLTPAEAAGLQLALLAVRSLLPDDQAQAVDALMAKIAGPPPIDLALVSGDEQVRRVINQAISEAQRLELTYDGQARGATTHPVVDPVRLTTTDSVVYLTAYCLTSGWRTYRLDRITAAKLTGESAQAHGPAPDPDAWTASLAASSTARLRLSPEAAWVGEHYPTRAVRQLPDGVEVELPVADPNWLVRLLLSLGSQVRQVDPPQYAEAANARACQALANYDLY